MRSIVIASALLVSGVASGRSNDTCREATPGLSAKAKVSCTDARRTALARVAHARVQSAELEEEGGRLVYSFDLKEAGKAGVEEVQIDAMTGAIASVEHETPAAEAHEKKTSEP